jgi:cell division septal protein FtsQ
LDGGHAGADRTQVGAAAEGVDALSRKAALLKAYSAATAAFSSRLDLLNGRIGTSSRDEYERLRRQVDEARVASEHGRLALERHVAEHGC